MEYLEHVRVSDGCRTTVARTGARTTQVQASEPGDTVPTETRVAMEEEKSVGQTRIFGRLAHRRHIRLGDSYFVENRSMPKPAKHEIQ